MQDAAPRRARYATRLNAFAAPGQPRELSAMVARAATARGLTHLDLNYPDQVDVVRPQASARMVADRGLALNGLAMRYYGDPAFRAGAFANPDPAARRRAIDLTRAGIDAAAACGAPLMTIWLGQDGFDTPFQADYGRLWDLLIDALAEVAAHAPEVAVSIEYKPDEPRPYALLPDCATTLLAIADVGAGNLGVTLDFAHMLYAGEQPAYAAALAARRSRVLGVHLNDGYGRRDDGLMVGAVHTAQTVEFLAQVRRDGYDGVLYFDTFPEATGLDPVAECEANVATTEALLAAVARLEADNGLPAAQAAQDAVAAHRIAQAAILGHG